MSTVSIAIIAHNEATHIKRSLASGAWADQIVVIDCESSDGTGEIARKSGAEVFIEPNRENLNVNKNIAIDHCSGDWVLVMDADEAVPDQLAGEIRRTIQATDDDGYLIPRRNIILGRWLRHGGQYPDWQLRLFRRGKGRFPARHVHERLSVSGAIGHLAEPMDHYPYLSVAEMLRKGNFYIEFEARHLLATRPAPSIGNILGGTVVRPTIRFLRRYILKGGFLDGVPGLAAACFDAWNQSARWLRFWDLVRMDRVGKSEEQ